MSLRFFGGTEATRKLAANQRAITAVTFRGRKPKGTVLGDCLLGGLACYSAAAGAADRPLHFACLVGLDLYKYISRSSLVCTSTLSRSPRAECGRGQSQVTSEVVFSIGEAVVLQDPFVKFVLLPISPSPPLPSWSTVAISAAISEVLLVVAAW